MDTSFSRSWYRWCLLALLVPWLACLPSRRKLWLSIVCLYLAFSVLPASAQRVLSLRDFNYPEELKRFDEELYFKDFHHDLDKFVGDWSGHAFNGDSIFIKISIVQDDPNIAFNFKSDVLAFDLQVYNQGGKYPSYEEKEPGSSNLLLGSSFFRGSARLRSRYKYKLWLSYKRETEEDLYRGAVCVIFELSKDKKTIQVRRWSLGVDTFNPKFPPYITKVPNEVMWTLQRLP